MSDLLARIRDQIDALSNEDREQLTTALAYSSSREAVTLDRNEQQILDVLRQLTGSRVPQQTLLRDYGIRKFRERAAELLTFIEDARHMLRQPQVHGLIEKCLRCLANDLRSRDIPVTPTTLLNSMSMLRHAVDQRFPGYAAAGHLHRLVPAA
jgi:hypothetical protein